MSNDELLDPVTTTDASEESETWQAIIASVPDSAARLTERSRLAKRLLIGFLTRRRADSRRRFDQRLWCKGISSCTA